MHTAGSLSHGGYRGKQEIAMTPQKHDSSAAKTNPSRLAHWGRVTLMILSFGMIYPNAMIEDMDMAKYDADNQTRGK